MTLPLTSVITKQKTAPDKHHALIKSSSTLIEEEEKSDKQLQQRDDSLGLQEFEESKGEIKKPNSNSPLPINITNVKKD